MSDAKVQPQPQVPSYEDAGASGSGAGAASPGPAIAMQPMGQPNMNTNKADKVTRLTHLSPIVEWIDCPFCHQRTQTRVVKEGSGMQFLTGALLCLACVCLAPLPCILHWFEETQWFCNGCNKMVATQRHDMPVQPLATYDQGHTDSRFNQGPAPPQPTYYPDAQSAQSPPQAPFQGNLPGTPPPQYEGGPQQQGFFPPGAGAQVNGVSPAPGQSTPGQTTPGPSTPGQPEPRPVHT